MSFLKDCSQCKFYQRGFCSYYSRNVLTTGEAQLCPYYSVIGIVTISDLANIAGSLSAVQIPSKIISTAKLDDLAVTSAKLANDSVTLVKILDAIITDAKIDPAAAIAESKLNLAFGTSALNSLISTNIGDISINEVAIAANAAAIILNDIDIAANLAAIALRELLSNKDAVNGYLGLDASAKVPLSKLNPLTNTEIAVAAAIAESKLSLTYPTHSNALDHAEAHTLASHSTKAHSELTDILASQHHAKYLNSEAVAAVEAHAVLNVKEVEADGLLYPKVTDNRTLGKSTRVWERIYVGDSGVYFGIGQDVNLYRSAADELKTDDTLIAGAGLKIGGTEVEIGKIYDMIQYGEPNAAWFPCSLFTSEKLEEFSRGSAWLTFTGPTTQYPLFLLPKATNLGSMKLHVSGVRIIIKQADASNYVTSAGVYAVDETSFDVVRDVPDDRKSAGKYDTTFTKVDCSARE